MPIESKIIYKELSYEINGILFKTHNKLGRFCREKQYTDQIEKLLKIKKIKYSREKSLNVPIEGNIPDFIIENKLIIEIKAKKIICKSDYYQIQRYLHSSNCKLGLLVNFRNRYLKPIRCIRIN